MMNRITIEFRLLCFDFALYVLGGSASFYAGALYFLVEALASLRITREVRRTTIILIGTYTAENMIDAELVLAFDVLRFIYTLIVLFIELSLVLESTGILKLIESIVESVWISAEVIFLTTERLTEDCGPPFQTFKNMSLHII